MSEQPGPERQRAAEPEPGVERGAAEDASGTPLTPTEVEASRRPPSAPSPDRSTDSRAGALDNAETEDSRQGRYS
jgi:hypothetical protein